MRWIMVCALTAAWAQDPTFRTQTREVIVPVSVMTKDGRPVAGLTREDFLVLDDGKPQEVQMMPVDTIPLPVYAVVVLQADAASEAALAKVKKTAAVISSYLTNDMGIGRASLTAVITISDEVRIAQYFTADALVLDDAFAAISAKGNSRTLVDGVDLACNLLKATDEASRRVIVLIGETRDLQSKSSFRDVAIKAQKENVVIYTISYSAFTTAFTQKASEPGLYDPSNHGGVDLLAIPELLIRLSKTNIADAFAQSTGGSHQKFATLRGLETQLTLIGNEIHNRYLLTFVPSKSQPGGYHQLSVGVRNPGNWQVHSRAGYWLAPN